MIESLFIPENLGVVVCLILIGASFFTSMLTASFGIGGGVALLTVMGYVLPVTALIPVHGVVQLGSNFSRAQLMRRDIVWPTIAPFLFGGFLGAWLGGGLVVQFPDYYLKIMLGLFVLLTVWAKPPAITDMGKSGLVIGGFLTSLLSMFIGATGPLVVALYERQFENRKNLVASHAAAMTLQHGLKALIFGFAGFQFSNWIGFISLMIASGYCGTHFGVRVLGKLEEERFRLIFRLIISLLACNLILSALVSLVN